MEILDTIILKEIEAIGKTTQVSIAHRWDMVIKANGKEIRPLYVDSLQLDRLYVENFADELAITAGFVPRDVFEYINPYKDTLEVTLIRTPLGASVDPIANPNLRQVKNTYRAHLVDASSTSIEGDDPLAINKGVAGSVDIRTATFQLYNPVIDHMRKSFHGTVYRKNTPMDVLYWILTEVAPPKTADVSVNIEDVVIADGYQDEVREHIPIDDATPILEIPFMINKMIGGFYPTGFGCYLQNRLWYVFPPYDCEAFGKRTPSLTVIKIPKHRMPSVNKTYRASSTQVTILTTRETKHTDLSSQKQLNTGNGVQFVDARNMIDGMAEIGGNKAVVKGSQNINQVVGDKMATGDMVAGAEKIVTNDYNLEYTKLALKMGSIIQTIWENANIDLLVPGMPVRYIFADGETPREIYGTLLAVESLDYKSNINIAEPRFTTMALLTIFVSRNNPMAKPSTSKTTVSKLTSN